MYRELNPRLICIAAQALTQRIDERFPDSGLRRVSEELLTVAGETEERIGQLRRPDWRLRLLVWSAIALALGAAVFAPVLISVRTDVSDISDLMQGIEAAINNIVFVAIALWFLATVEQRPRRKLALAGLHELRSLAHIIDLHQLNKDPDPAVVRTEGGGMSRRDLACYLDFCSELLSIVSKLAALYAQYLIDERVLGAVNDVETLAGGLSSKIWQKIMILDTVAGRDEGSDLPQDSGGSFAGASAGGLSG
ncbi:MAG TPA: hypothetical protein VLI06_11990 [Solimonas sp.]|nr:hypothetical protein [Solimonas sp.]